MNDIPPASDIPDARLRLRRLSWIWLIPLAAALVAGYLAYTTWASRGPLVTIEFDSAEGLTAGQTQVRYKSVPVGTVQSVRLIGDLSRIRISARMQRDVADRLTGDARFWVVRPRLTAGNVSGLETIVSGPYIEFDPGTAGLARRRSFVGLEEPPGIRAGEPGRVFTLRTRRLGALRPGSTVMFRDVSAGEVLSLDPLAPDGEITLRVFIRAPYDGYVRRGSRFWSTSGVSANFGPNGLRVEFESLRAVLTGGVAFDTPAALLAQPEAPASTTFVLYENQEVAITATSPKRLEFMTYLDGSAGGLGVGSPVEIRGIRVGSVTSVDLLYDTAARRFVVPVHMVVEPSRIVSPDSAPALDVKAA
ncbi:MAG: MCE family protein, partial [Proteobacteria bacterium]|nr:MCE family protein [Pseudomonadota bacterium]